jgi:hypothetical protein
MYCNTELKLSSKPESSIDPTRHDTTRNKVKFIVQKDVTRLLNKHVYFIVIEGEVRLIGTRKPNTGLVQIFHQNRWGFVCDDYWGTPDTTVVCRQLGYLRGGRTVKHKATIENVLFWMDNVACYGNETSLSQCTFPGWNKHDCVAGESVIVECFLWLLDGEYL